MYNIKQTSSSSANYTELNAHLVKYQNPKEADALTKLQMDLDETKIILVTNLIHVYI